MRRIINIFLTLIILISLTSIGLKLYKYYYDEQNNKKLQVLNPIQENKNQDESNKEIYDLKNINSDYKLWIKIENTDINYPVVKGIDNEFYLNRNFYKDKNISGTLFIDYRNNLDDENLVIYGHNMKNKTMFQNLNKFLDKDFFYNNDTIEIIVDNKIFIYKIFSVYTTSNAEDYLVPNFNSAKDFNKYMEKINEKSFYKKELTMKVEDRIVTLGTCTNDLNDSRIIVHGKLLSK